LTEGYGPAAELPAAPGVRYFAALERVAPRYPYDLRRTEQLMAEAGFSRGPEGIYVGVEGQHSPELMGVAEGLEAQETTIIADYLKQAGIDAQLRLVPQAQLQQFDEMKSLYPAWRTNYGYGAPKDLSAGRMLGARASKAENRWGGTNKMGFDNPEHDQLYARWIQTLDVAEADRILVQIGRMHMEELPYIPNYFSPEVIAHARSLNGPTVGFGTSWHNIHEWSWK
jgi:peptide/nickel transport system substrate-binding protein